MGRTIVDVYGDQVGASLEETASFSKYAGGCPANIAIGTARLGLRVGMITRVGDDHHGRYLRRTFQAEQVDTTCVVTDPGRSTAVVFLGIRDKATFPLLHYRADCADMAISPEDYSEEYIGSATAVLVTGSHLTTEHAANNIGMAISRAKARGTKVIFDIDYRPVFWGLVHKEAGDSRYVSADIVTRATQRYLPLCDLIVGTEEEIHIAGGTTDTIAALRAVRALTAAPIVLKRGAAGCAVFPAEIPDSVDGGILGTGYPVEIFNLVGAGDGFLSGFLSGWLRGLPWTECCSRGNAAGALVVSRQGCSPASPTAPELEWFLSRGNLDPALHRNRELAYLHRATTRRARPSPVCVLAVDHAKAFSSLPTAQGRPVSKLKALIADTALQMSPRYPQLGILLDDREGEDALLRVGSALPWVGRKIEESDCVPLKLTGGLPAAVLMSHWPRYQIAKCLVPQEDASTQAVQNERLLELYYAAEMYGIELLLELTHDDTPADAGMVLERIRSMQRMGVRPDWWKLPAFSDRRFWSEVSTVIRADNPLCRGILLLGGGRGDDDLLAAMDVARTQPIVQGFAIGRSVFLEPAARWLAARCSDAEFQELLTGRFDRFAEFWLQSAELTA